MIPFNVPVCTEDEIQYLEKVVLDRKLSGDGSFTKACNHWMEERFNVQKVLLTTSGTSALDMAMQLCDFQDGDEVILPSFTFSSTATSAVLAGAKLVFVDIRPDTMNIDESKIEAAITSKTKAIVVVHYAGVSCEMDMIMEIAHKYGLLVIEDAAQGVMSSYKGRSLGTIGDFGCYSFHETKNYTMGEGGALLIRDPKYNEKAEILREKGTNRSKFFRGEVDKYTWVGIGDSYLPSELNAAYLWSQLQHADEINEDRLKTWKAYYDAFYGYAGKDITLPTIPCDCEHNAHIFYIKLPCLEDRDLFIQYMKSAGVHCTFHYVPLHSAPAGKKYGRFSGEDAFTTAESDKLVRLPLYYHMSEKDREIVIRATLKFMENRYNCRK